MSSTETPEESSAYRRKASLAVSLSWLLPGTNPGDQQSDMLSLWQKNFLPDVEGEPERKAGIGGVWLKLSQKTKGTIIPTALFVADDDAPDGYKIIPPVQAADGISVKATYF